jgi:CheY-like chemotaxis protein
MGGRIWLESQLGRGSVFHFVLPFEIRATSTTSTQRALKDLRGMRALIVDDNATNRRILEETLNRWGLQPTVVDGASAAMHAFDYSLQSGGPFRFALIDFQMPDLDGFGLAELIRKRPEFDSTAILMLSSVGHRSDATRSRQLGISTYLTKPVRQSVLLDAILVVLDGEEDTSLKESGIWETAAMVADRPLRILVAEDNVINRRVVVAILERKGHVITVAANGHEAVRAAAENTFDLALMDVQMPEMDGLEATAAIRTAERHSGLHLPIIAVTANAMKGDIEICLNAGMDSYLSKPVNATELLALVDSMTAPGSGTPAEAAAPPSAEGPAGHPAMDLEDVLERVGGDRALLMELAQLFRNECLGMLSRIRLCIDDDDAAGLEMAAHSFKGACLNLGAGPTASAALVLELKGRTGILKGALSEFEELQRQAERLDAALLDLNEAA